MGYGPIFLRDIITLKRRGLLEGYRRIVEIGAQQISDRAIGSPELDEAVSLFGGPRPELNATGSFGVGQNSSQGRLLWSALGLHSQSMDIEGADIFIDLNTGYVPEQYRGAFDFAINAGTTEHVANQGNAFAAIHDLVRVGGMMYHEVPASGNIDHGFFGYHPKFFHRLANANEYDMVYFDLRIQGEFAPPDYLRESLREKLLRTQLGIAMVRKPAGQFKMPIDK
jgi:hypothetical protein